MEAAQHRATRRVTEADFIRMSQEPNTMVLDARSNPKGWERFTAGLEGSAWYLLRIHQALSHRLPASRSTALLGEAVQDLLSSASYRRLVPHGIAPAVWAASYLERPEAHPQH